MNPYTFWIQVIENNLMLIQQRLPIQYKDLHAEVAGLIQIGSQLINMRPMYEDIDRLTMRLIQFIQRILNGQFEGEVKIAINPTILSNMITETYEARFELLNESQPLRHPTGTELDLYKFWIADIIGNLSTLQGEIDPIEMNLKKDIRHQKKKYHNLHHQTLSLIMYLMNGGLVPDATIQKLNSDVIALTLYHLDFLRDLHDSLKEGKTLGMVTPEMVEHSFRKYSYYLQKLSHSLQ